MYFKDQSRVIKQRDPAIKSSLEVILYPSFWAVLFHRLAHFLFKHHRFFLARFVSQLSRGFTGIEIHPGAKVGKGFFIDHGAGVVVGETCEIGTNVLLYQGVTLGGTGKGVGRRHPIIGDNVLVGAGAKVLGPIKIGNNSLIGAGSVVLNDVPDNCTVVGIPGRVVRQNGEDMKIQNDTLKQDLPDVVSQEIAALGNELEDIKRQLEKAMHEAGIHSDSQKTETKDDIETFETISESLDGIGKALGNITNHIDNNHIDN